MSADEAKQKMGVTPDPDAPVYPMGVAADLLGVHPRTLRIYEEEGLINPLRRGGKRFFSQSDVAWIQCLRGLIHDENISIEGVKRLLELAPCWRFKKCPDAVRKHCPGRRLRHGGGQGKGCARDGNHCERGGHCGGED